MKPVLLVSLALCVAILACGQPTPMVTTPPETTNWSTFTVNGFSVELPDHWGQEASDDEQVIHAISDGKASLWIKTWPLIPSLVASAVEEWVVENSDATLLSTSGEADQIQLKLQLNEGVKRLQLSTRLFYCDAKAYEVTGVVEQSGLDEYNALFEQAHASATCSSTERYPQLNSGALGMIIIPPAVEGDEFSPTAYQESIALARSRGVQVSHYYFHWGDIEKEPGIYDWTVPDYIVEANVLEGMQLSIVVSVIHTTVRGRIPQDLVGLAFDDPLFLQRLGDFFSTFAERYAGRLHYLSIGNEVNNYFATHRDEIPAYRSAFEYTRDAIHRVNPDLPVGIIFAYHDAETLDAIDVIQELNRGDYVAYTMYLYNEGFHFWRDPGEIGGYLDRMIDLAGSTPVVITETGWSTATELDGSEEGQSEYVRQLFSALEERRERIGFVSWFAMHDPSPDSCERDVLTFFEPGTEPGGEFMDAFETFICYFGLRHSDGTPKPAWEAWIQAVDGYYR